MKLDYFYRKTDIIQKNLRQLEVLKQALNLLPPLPHIERNLRRQSVLKSSLFSARIEGNRLNASDISFVNMERKPANLAKLEIFNISRAINFLYSSSGPAILSKEFLLELHKRIMQNIVLCRKYKTNVVFFTFARNKYEMKGCQDLLSFLRVIGFTPGEAKNALENIDKLFNKKKYIMKGFRIVE